MLRKAIVLGSLFFCLNALACWKVEGSFAVDGETWKINNKFDHNKEYAFPMGPFILRMTLTPETDKTQTLVYSVHEKKGTTLTLVTQGTEKGIKADSQKDIFASGEEGQPNSIISIKLIGI